MFTLAYLDIPGSLGYFPPILRRLSNLLTSYVCLPRALSFSPNTVTNVVFSIY